MAGGSDIAALKTALAAAEARAANAEAKVSDAAAVIAFLKLTIKKLQRELYGHRSERKQRLLDQLELQLDELEASATEDELAAEKAAAETTQVKGFTRRKPARKPFPAHLPRERVVVIAARTNGYVRDNANVPSGRGTDRTAAAVGTPRRELSAYSGDRLRLFAPSRGERTDTTFTRLPSKCRLGGSCRDQSRPGLEREALPVI